MNPLVFSCLSSSTANKSQDVLTKIQAIYMPYIATWNVSRSDLSRSPSSTLYPSGGVSKLVGCTNCLQRMVFVNPLLLQYSVNLERYSSVSKQIEVIQLCDWERPLRLKRLIKSLLPITTWKLFSSQVHLLHNIIWASIYLIITSAHSVFTAWECMFHLSWPSNPVPLRYCSNDTRNSVDEDQLQHFGVLY